MKTKNLLIICVLTFIIGGCASQKVSREEIEWSDFRWEHESDRSKPRVLLIGASISNGYFPEVSLRLKGIANCDHYATSRSLEDPELIKETKRVMGNYNHSVIHFYEGLHGWHLTNEEYKRGLEKYVKFLLSKKTKDCDLIYSLITPYPSKEPGVKFNPVKNQVVLNRNRMAWEVMKKYGIQVIDAYSLMEPELEKYSKEKGDVHYNKKGYERLAKQITEEIQKRLYMKGIE